MPERGPAWAIMHGRLRAVMHFAHKDPEPRRGMEYKMGAGFMLGCSDSESAQAAGDSAQAAREEHMSQHPGFIYTGSFN